MNNNLKKWKSHLYHKPRCDDTYCENVLAISDSAPYMVVLSNPDDNEFTSTLYGMQPNTYITKTYVHEMKMELYKRTKKRKSQISNTYCAWDKSITPSSSVGLHKKNRKSAFCNITRLDTWSDVAKKVINKNYHTRASMLPVPSCTV